MKKAKPTVTHGPLHFGDLDPLRFEDFCLQLVFPLYEWENFRHYGRSGNDGGIDILADQPQRDSSPRRWVIQCRRYQKATAATLTKAVDDSLASLPAPPDVLLVVIPCSVRREAQERFFSYAEEKGVVEPKLWTGSIVEAFLYSRRTDLLRIFFGVTVSDETQEKAAEISRQIALKRLMRSELIRRDAPAKALSEIRPFDKFVSGRSEVLVHSIDDTSYPDLDPSPTGVSSWLKFELFDFYFNGIEVILDLRHGAVALDGSRRWTVVPYGFKIDERLFREVKLWHVGLIPYRNIVAFDVDGDEIEPIPHLFCEYRDKGRPYERSRWCVVGEEFLTRLEDSRRLVVSEPEEVKAKRRKARRASPGGE